MRSVWLVIGLLGLAFVSVLGQNTECDSKTAPSIRGLVGSPNAVFPDTDITVSGTFYGFAHPVANCYFWVANTLKGSSTASSVSTTQITCRVPALPTATDGTAVKVTVQVYDITTVLTNSNDCYSSRGTDATGWLSSYYTSFTYYLGVECVNATVPQFTGTQPTAIVGGADVTFSANFAIFTDTQVNCGWWIPSFSTDIYQTNPAASFSKGSVTCLVPTRLASDGTEVRVTLQVFRTSTVNKNNNYCYSYEGVGINGWSAGDYVSMTIWSGAECIAATVPTIQSVTPSTVSPGVTVIVTGIWAFFSDTLGTCTFWTDNGTQQMSSTANVLSSTTLACVFPSGMTIATGTTVYVTAKVYRNSATNPNSNNCFSMLGRSFASWTPEMYKTVNYQGTECLASTIPTISLVSPSTAINTDSLTITGNFYVADDTVAKCIFWINNVSQDSSDATSITTSQITCPVPNLGTTSAPVKVTVQVYRTSATIPNANPCFSSNGLPPTQWNTVQFGTFVYDAQSHECTPNTVPTISSISPSSGAVVPGANITLTGTYDVHADTVAVCIFWVNDVAQGGSDATRVTATEIECPVKALALTANTQIKVTVQVYRTSAVIPNLDDCYSSLGQYPSQWTSEKYATFTYNAQSAECSVSGVPTITSVTNGGAAGDTLTIQGNFHVVSDTVATCIFWVNDIAQGGSTATSVISTTIQCPIKNLGLSSNTDVKVTVQVYRSAATVPNLNVCYSSLGQAPSQWTAEQFGTFTYIANAAVECSANTVPTISGVSPSIAGPMMDLKVSGTFSVSSDTVANCIFWLNNTAQGGEAAIEVTSTQITCPVKDLDAEGTFEVKVTVQVYRSSAQIPNLDTCYSSLGQAPSQWTSEKYAVFTYDSSLTGDSTRNTASLVLLSLVAIVVALI